MNVIQFNATKTKIAYCVVDDTKSYQSQWSTEIVKNIADFTIGNLCTKQQSVFQGINEDQLLRHASDLGYEYAVVFSAGTEFINGLSFLNEVATLTETDFFIAGHILDRSDAYYELHHQCYVINLMKYAALDYPTVGQQELGSHHEQSEPIRSVDNIHDNYTPTHVSQGFLRKMYHHKLHGWNILSTAFNFGLPVVVFNNQLRNNKKYYYPESQQEFLKHSAWLYARLNYCATEFIHTSNTETINQQLTDIEQVFAPASGVWWQTCISRTLPVTVVLYDYNQRALDYWKINAPVLENVTYKFVKKDLLVDDLNLSKWFDPTKPTLINLSNIFAYEGTSTFYSLEYRMHKENQVLQHIKTVMPDAIINFSARASTGFVSSELTGTNLPLITYNSIRKPSWHW